MLSISRRYSTRVLAGLACVLAASAWCISHIEAQPGRGLGRSRSQSPLIDPNSLLSQLRNDDLLDELGVTEAQREEFSAIRSEFGQTMFRGGGSTEEKQQKLKDLESRALSVLTAEQLGIWDQRKPDAKADPAGDGEKSQAKLKSPEPAKPETAAPSEPPKQTAPAEKPPSKPERSPQFDTPPPGASVKASFDAKDTTKGGSKDVGGKLSFNFQYAPWKDVLELFAKSADLTLDLEITPPGTFSYRDSQSYTPTQALDVLNGYLLQRGYLIVRRDRFLVCLKIADGIPPNLAPQISLEELTERGKNELVSVVIPVRGMQADAIIAEVRELLGPQGKASALKNTNSVVVTDLGSHVRRIHALLTSESAIDTRDTAFKSIPLKHISAGEAERMIRKLFGLNAPVAVGGQPQPSSPGQPPQWGPGGGWGGRRGRGDRGDRGGENEQDQQQNGQGGPPQPPQQAAPAAGGDTQFAKKIQVSADVRTNSLLVTTSAALLKVVEDAVTAIDTNVDSAGNEIRRVDMPIVLRTYSVPGGDVATVSMLLYQSLPGIVVTSDSRTGKLYIHATAEEHTEVAKLLEDLGGEGSSSVAVIPISKKDPVTLCNTLLSLYSKDGARAPTMEADPVGRLIIVRGTPDQLLQVKTILAQLGEGGEGQEKTDRGNVRTLTLGGRDPEELLPLLKGSWSATRPNPIRIVVPSRPSPIRGRSVPGADRRQPDVKEDRVSEPVKSSQPLFRSAALEETVVEDDAQPADEPDEKQEAVKAEGDAEAAPADRKSAPVSVEILGDQIVITSEDQQALDQIEELYERLSGIIPPRTKWHVFYLRTADATEAAQMVERLFPQSNVTASTSSSSSGLLGSLAGGVGSIGRGLMNVSGLNQTLSGSQSLKVVTDIRANALFVSGPLDQVTEVEQILEVLDSPELPQSLRDRVPRTIAVKHADVDEVAAEIETLFKDSMTPEGQMGGGRGMNPLMMLMGGGGQQQQGGRRQPSVQLTVAVDRKSSHLIVSCNDALFQQIEEVVQGYDERAKESRQTVRVVRLDQADPTLVQQTLGSLMPKITVGSTRRARRPTTGGATQPAAPQQPQGQGGDSPRRGGEGGDAMRDAMIRQMMQDRAGGGGEGGEGRRGGFFGRGRGN